MRSFFGMGGPGKRVPGERFKGKVALVAGASVGIGLATAVAFAREGARVVLLARRDREGNEALDATKKAGGEEGEAIFIRADVSDTAQVRDAFARVRDTFGRLDAAFNNAGVMHPGGPVGSLPESEFDRLVAVNVKGVWLCMREEIALMEKEGGAIVNMSSISGLVGTATLGFYVMTKHAVVGLTRSAALDYAAKGIRINAICPGYVRTPMTERVPESRIKEKCPTGKMGESEDVADAVLWMCSDEARYLIGSSLVLDGGTIARY
jgi:NAD(P)-dependent dehydrogenase (short-subunit alcohol dehydrogenase family)